MVWHVRKQLESDDAILIEYSFERNDTCDGLLRYSKPTHEIRIDKMSEGAGEFNTKRLFSIIHGLLSDNGLSEKKRRIAVG